MNFREYALIVEQEERESIILEFTDSGKTVDKLDSNNLNDRIILEHFYAFAKVYLEAKENNTHAKERRRYPSSFEQSALDQEEMNAYSHFLKIRKYIIQSLKVQAKISNQEPWQLLNNLTDANVKKQFIQNVFDHKKNDIAKLYGYDLENIELSKEDIKKIGNKIKTEIDKSINYMNQHERLGDKLHSGWQSHIKDDPTPEELQHMKNKRYDKKTNRFPGLDKQVWMKTFRNILKSQSPITDIIKDLSLDLDDPNIIRYAKQNNLPLSKSNKDIYNFAQSNDLLKKVSNQEIIQSAKNKNIPIILDILKPHLIIDLLKSLAIKSQANQSLSGDEQRIYKAWKQFKEVEPYMAQPFYKYATKNNIPLFNDDDLEDIFVSIQQEYVKNNLSYFEDPSHDEASRDAKFDRGHETYQRMKHGWEGKLDWNPHKVAANKEKNKNIQPYVSIDYHNSLAMPNMELNEKYFNPSKDGKPTVMDSKNFSVKGKKELLHPACKGARGQLNRRLQLDKKITDCICGRCNATADEADTDEKIKLSKYDSTAILSTLGGLPGVALDIIFMTKQKDGTNGLLNSTGLKDWEKDEKVRINRAWTVTNRLIDKALATEKHNLGTRTRQAGEDEESPLNGVVQQPQASSNMVVDLDKGTVSEPQDNSDMKGKDAFDPEVIKRFMQNPEASIQTLSNSLLVTTHQKTRQQIAALRDKIQSLYDQQQKVAAV